ncbi:MAG: hypothetical protein JWQ81_7491 [Amycolatopsis sp.]|jgi:hypothetical protein|uniref:hypothetical protein n=1 Tax=Amycolatopsis sp. TaxID=37632 RepID=UPI0026045BE4|nr:hypothetical protein [Amycolatopsis sp.]MCU1686752.1 hypothetical protein [Amycolatopsis sp.]
MSKQPERRSEPDENLTTDFPSVPNRDVGTDGTNDVDLPANTDEDVPRLPEPPG